MRRTTLALACVALSLLPSALASAQYEDEEGNLVEPAAADESAPAEPTPEEPAAARGTPRRVRAPALEEEEFTPNHVGLALRLSFGDEGPSPAALGVQVGGTWGGAGGSFGFGYVRVPGPGDDAVEGAAIDAAISLHPAEWADDEAYRWVDPRVGAGFMLDVLSADDGLDTGLRGRVFVGVDIRLAPLDALAPMLVLEASVLPGETPRWMFTVGLGVRGEPGAPALVAED